MGSSSNALYTSLPQKNWSTFTYKTYWAAKQLVLALGSRIVDDIVRTPGAQRSQDNIALTSTELTRYF